jgi:hypothetical protein
MIKQRGGIIYDSSFFVFYRGKYMIPEITIEDRTLQEMTENILRPLD